MDVNAVISFPIGIGHGGVPVSVAIINEEGPEALNEVDGLNRLIGVLVGEGCRGMLVPVAVISEDVVAESLVECPINRT